jgi:hypothetical protein
MTSAERQTRHRQRLTAAGLVQVNVWVLPSAAPDINRAAELCRAHPHLTTERVLTTTD